VSFVSVDALERELRRLEAGRQTSSRNDIPDDPVEFAKMLDLEPEAWQRDMLRSDRRQHIILAARRTGKSTTAALLALHRLLTIPGFRTIFAAPSLEQAQIPYLMVVSMYRQLGRPVPAISERRTGLEVVGGGSVLAMSSVERTRRGHGCDWLVVDEASRVDDPSYYGALLPSITRPVGYLTLMSTPFSRQGFFAATWHDDDDSGAWRKTKVTVEDSEYFREHPEGLQLIRRSVPRWYYEREYLCEFQEDEGAVFATTDIEAALRAGEDLEAITFQEDDW
jgi:hypothetical protein